MRLLGVFPMVTVHGADAITLATPAAAVPPNRSVPLVVGVSLRATSDCSAAVAESLGPRPPGVAALGVGTASDSFCVVRVHATPVRAIRTVRAFLSLVAKMVDLESRRDGSDKSLVGKTVSPHHLPIVCKLRIPILIQSSRPNPTPGAVAVVLDHDKAHEAGNQIRVHAKHCSGGA